jgi:hypothetical protein
MAKETTMDESQETEEAFQRLKSGRPLNSRHLSLLLRKPSGIATLQGVCKLKIPTFSSQATDAVNNIERAELSKTRKENNDA